MTDNELEQRLRAWYRDEVDDIPSGPVELRESVLAIPRSLPVRVRRSGARRRTITLLAAAAILIGGGAVAVGSGLVKLSAVVVVPPSPSPSTGLLPTPSPGLQTPSPTDQATPSPATALGGGMLLVRDIPRDANGTPIDTVHGFGTGTYDVSLVDPETGARTLLGTVPYDWRTGYTPEFRWAPDGRHAMITDRRGKLWNLDSPTAAASQVVFACCERPGVVGWVFSPRSDRIAGLAQSEETVPGQQGVQAVADAIVISNVDGTGLRTLPLPKGADTGAAGVTLSWAPDESAVVLAGCRPCNYADLGAKPKDLTHSRLFIVPLDGSPVRELLDETREGMSNPSWSSDGDSIIVGRNDCAAGEIQPYCGNGRLSVASVRLADGQQTILAPAPDIFFGPWLSPDGRRIAYSVEKMPSPGSDVIDTTGGIYVVDVAGGNPTRLADGFDPRWSPDGQWLLYSDPGGTLWIMSADGGQQRSIGTYAAAGW